MTTSSSSRKSTLCAHKTAAGRPCKAHPVGGSRFCWAHAPSLARKRAKARSQGGRKRAYGDLQPPSQALEGPGDILSGLRHVLAATWKQDNTARRTRALVGAYGLALRVFEVTELEKRLAAIEKRMEEVEREEDKARPFGAALPQG